MCIPCSMLLPDPALSSQYIRDGVTCVDPLFGLGRAHKLMMLAGSLAWAFTLHGYSHRMKHAYCMGTHSAWGRTLHGHAQCMETHIAWTLIPCNMLNADGHSHFAMC